MTDGSSIEDRDRVISEFEESQARQDSRFNQFASAMRDVYPEQFDGNLTIRRSYKTLREIKDLITVRTRFQIVGMISIALGFSSGLVSLADGWGGMIANAQVAITILEFALLALGLTSVGWAEFGLRRKIRSHIEHLEQVATENLTHRTLYFGSAQYSISLGDKGVRFFSNRLSAFLSYWAIDLDKFIADNGFPTIDVSPFRNVPLSEVKSGRADGDEFNEFFDAITRMFASDQRPRHISLPLITEGSLLHPDLAEKDEHKKASRKKIARNKNGPISLETETLNIPLDPFITNRDSDINPVEFTICLYFAISRAHIDRINMILK